MYDNRVLSSSPRSYQKFNNFLTLGILIYNFLTLVLLNPDTMPLQTL